MGSKKWTLFLIRLALFKTILSTYFLDKAGPSNEGYFAFALPATKLLE